MKRLLKRNTKKTKRPFNIHNFAMKLFACTAMLYLLTSIMLRAFNSYLNVKTQDYTNNIVTLRKQNEVVRMEVNQLRTYDRISSITQAQGMSVTNNIYNVTNNE